MQGLDINCFYPTEVSFLTTNVAWRLLVDWCLQNEPEATNEDAARHHFLFLFFVLIELCYCCRQLPASKCLRSVTNCSVISVTALKTTLTTLHSDVSSAVSHDDDFTSIHTFPFESCWMWVVFCVNAQQLQCLRFPPWESDVNWIQRLTGTQFHFFLLSFFPPFFLSLFLTSYLALTLNVSSFIVINKPKEGDEYLSLMISSQSKVMRPLCFVLLPSREAAHSQSWVVQKLDWARVFFVIFFFFREWREAVCLENKQRHCVSVTASVSLHQRPLSVLFVCVFSFFWKLYLSECFTGWRLAL